MSEVKTIDGATVILFLHDLVRFVSACRYVDEGGLANLKKEAGSLYSRLYEAGLVDGVLAEPLKSLEAALADNAVMSDFLKRILPILQSAPCDSTLGDECEKCGAVESAIHVAYSSHPGDGLMRRLGEIEAKLVSANALAASQKVCIDRWEGTLRHLTLAHEHAEWQEDILRVIARSLKSEADKCQACGGKGHPGCPECEWKRSMALAIEREEERYERDCKELLREEKETVR